ncbi:MAG: sulfotransferase family protein [Chlorobi bacterium]|nr:sulfotransferase family protein [Chlorobiota bacterium]
MKELIGPKTKTAVFRVFDLFSVPLYMVTTSEKSQYAFFLIHKNGISSILSVLREETQREIDESYTIYHKSKYKNHFKFCFIRNPWDRLVSCYTNKVVRKQLFPGCWGKDFAYFVDFVSHQHLASSDKHIKLQTSQFPVKDIDYIARFENFESEYNFIINDKLNLNREMVVKNKSNHRHYSEMYDDKTRRIVEQVYKADIEIGNYKFGK